MGSLARSALRNKAKKIYKKSIKSIPKGSRISFAEFFKKYKNSKNAEQDINLTNKEDFDFENFVNVNEINDDSLVVEEDEVETNEEKE